MAKYTRPMNGAARPEVIDALAHGNAIDSRIARRLAALRAERDAIQAQIDHYEFVAADLTHTRTAKKQEATAALVSAAINLETGRRRKGSERVAEIIAAVADDEPIHAKTIAERAGVHTGTVLNWLRSHGGYRKTGKADQTRWLRKGTKRTPTSKAGKRRARMAEFLGRYDPIEPRPGGQRVAPYVRRGYLAKSGDGYVRTEKPTPATA